MKLGYVPLFLKYVGDPSRPEDRARLEAKSPLFRAEDAQRPILIIHGARDERVKLRESEQMVEALRRAGKDVRFVVFPDEGHRRDYGNSTTARSSCSWGIASAAGWGRLRPTEESL